MQSLGTRTVFGSPFEAPERVRARDVQMYAVALLETRTILVSGTLETSDRAVMVSYDLPSEGQWTFIKTETNLSDRPWNSWIMSVDSDGRFVDDPSCPNVAMQFKNSLLSEDGQRLGFYGGEVRPGESVLKRFTIVSPSRRFYMSHGQRHSTGALPPEDQIRLEILNGYALDPAYEILVPVEIRY